METKTNIAASVRARLLNLSRSQHKDFSAILTRYSLERLLYRLSISKHRNFFLLKGALLFDLWFNVPHRPTRDIDLLGLGTLDHALLEKMFRDICTIEVEDGIVFDPATIKITEIRKEANYGGSRITFSGNLASARCPIQIDIGLGDAVTPAPEEATYPVLLEEFPAPQLKSYPSYSVIAEKLEAVISLGMANSRVKDYFDLWILSQYTKFEGYILQKAIRATLERRKTILNQEAPLGLSQEFSLNIEKQNQWKAFLKKNKLEAPDLELTVSEISNFLNPLLEAIHKDFIFEDNWLPSGPWIK